MNDKIRFVICAYLNSDPNRIHQLYCCVYSILSQTHKNLEIYIHHDGPINDTSLPLKFEAIDSRIKFIVLPVQKKTWGFYDRRDIALMEPHADWIVFTNDDNYYIPRFAEDMIRVARENVSEMAFCNMLHSHWGYSSRESILQVAHIDMGNFMSSTRLVKETPWTNFTEEGDGYYAMDIAKKTKPVKLSNFLFVHN
jgi:glycosyltransferase involved in cell wall biosynthesis